MRWLLLFSYACLLLHTRAAAQNDPVCASPPPNPAVWDFIEQHRDATTGENTFRLPVTLHMVRLSNGSSSFNTQIALDALCAANARFQPVGISFYLASPVRFINRSDLVNPASFAAASAILDEFNVFRTINIYYTNLANFGTCAFAFFPGIGPGSPQNQGGVVMGTNCASPDGALLAHELGHFFNLPHTFDETADNPRDWLFAERVTRNNNETAPRLSANCNNAGDRFCDTPADFLPIRWNCPNTIAQTDTNGDLFQPDPTLYMGYARDTCMQRFSPQQIAVMRATLANANAPRGYLLLSPLPVGPATVQTPQQLVPGSVDSQISISQPLFRWSRVPGANWYHFRLFQFTSQQVIDTVIADTSFSPPAGLLRLNRPYRWQIRALGTDALCSAPSPFFSFSAIASSSTESSRLWGVNIFPQPAAGFIQIAAAWTSAPVELLLYDLQGKPLAKAWFSDAATQGTLTWQIPQLAAGMYLLELRQNELSSRHKVLLTQP